MKNKNVKVTDAYVVSDGSYEYNIKTIDDSTKVLIKNGKVIQDSGPLNYDLSPRQTLLVYREIT